jgi:hypothetical protein
VFFKVCGFECAQLFVGYYSERKITMTHILGWQYIYLISLFPRHPFHNVTMVKSRASLGRLYGQDQNLMLLNKPNNVAITRLPLEVGIYTINVAIISRGLCCGTLCRKKVII